MPPQGQSAVEALSTGPIPPWREGDERRVSVDCDQLYVRVVERMDKERVIYTLEIDQLCVVERASALPKRRLLSTWGTMNAPE
jgi:hypothetical protein